VFLIALAAMAAFERSPFGASLRGTRDQARRMTALGYNVWLIRFLAFLFSGFWCSVAGLLYLYNKQFVGPQVAALQASAEALLMVISGGTATLLGPVAGAALVVIVKYVVSAYVTRWNLVLGVIFVVIISFMPEGLVPGSIRLWGFAKRRFFRARSPDGGAPRRNPGSSLQHGADSTDSPRNAHGAPDYGAGRLHPGYGQKAQP
jgi:branched-chain amino acid transport system permease protein